jgi:hypothetical protein
MVDATRITLKLESGGEFANDNKRAKMLLMTLPSQHPHVPAKVADSSL